MRIAVINFSTDKVNETADYEYLMADSIQGTPTHAVIRGGPQGTGMKVVRIKEIRDPLNQQYSGELKPIVTAFTLDEYEEILARQKRRAQLEIQLKRKLDKLSLIQQFALLGGAQDKETNDMLAEYAKL